MNVEKVLDRVKRDIKELSKMYNTDESKNKNNKELNIDYDNK